MTYRLLSITLICILFFACKQKCTINCQAHPTIVTTGYSAYELDTLIVISFIPGGTFNSPVDSYFITPTDKPWWIFGNDSTTKVFSFGGYERRNFRGYNLIDYINDKANKRFFDFEIIIPSNNRIYRISNLKLYGSLTNEITCKGGSVSSSTPCNSRQYLVGYTINGADTTFPPGNLSYVYIYK